MSRSQSLMLNTYDHGDYACHNKLAKRMKPNNFYQICITLLINLKSKYEYYSMQFNYVCVLNKSVASDKLQNIGGSYLSILHTSIMI